MQKIIDYNLHIFLRFFYLVRLFFKYLPHHLIHKNQAAGHVEGTLEGGTLAGGQGGIAVPAEVAVPLAVLVS